MTDSANDVNEKNVLLQDKYNITAWFYDILDYPWERMYKKWRPGLVKDLRGKVLEVGVGTGHNLKHYHSDVKLTAIDLSERMIRKAKKKARSATCEIKFRLEDATVMESIPSSYFDWVFSTFMCCVMPNDQQPLAIKQFERVLKPGGKFRLVEILYSKDPKQRRRQEFLAPFVEKVYGARFDRHTLEYLEESPKLKVTKTYFLKADTHLVIEGERVK